MRSTNRVFTRCLSVILGDTDGTSERIHGMNYQIASGDMLIANFLLGKGVAFCPSPTAEANLPVPENSDDFVIGFDWKRHLSE
jgi:hypothetical protein